MTFEELMNQGKAELAEKREREQAAEQAVAAKRAFEQAEFDHKVLQGVRDLLPEALWPYIEIPETHVGQWDVEITIEAPDCAPIKASYYPADKKFNDRRESFYIGIANKNNYYDWNELYEPHYEFNRNSLKASTITEALALAAEQYETMLRYESEYGLLLAEYEAKQAAELAATTAETGEAAPQPTMADKLEAIIREIVRAEVCAYNEGGY